MKKVMLILLTLLMLASVSFAGMGCSDDDPDVTWRMATFSIPGDIMHDALLSFADEVNDKSDGRMEIKVSNTLYEGTGIFDAVSSQNVDLGLIAGTWLGTKMPLYTAVYVYPFGDNITDRLLMQEAVFAQSAPVLKESQDNDVMTPFMLDAGMLMAMFTDPVTSIGDVKGMNLWTPGDVADDIIQYGFQATPVPMDITGIYMAAQTGTIEGTVFMAIDMYYNQKFYEVMPYLVLGGGIHFGSTVLMNTDSFAALPEDLQQIVLEAGLNAQAKSIADKDAQFDSIVDDLEANPNVHVTELSPVESATWMGTMDALLQAGLALTGLTEEQIGQIMTIAEAAIS